jgi:hypothetical protein
MMATVTTIMQPRGPTGIYRYASKHSFPFNRRNKLVSPTILRVMRSTSNCQSRRTLLSFVALLLSPATTAAHPTFVDHPSPIRTSIPRGGSAKTATGTNNNTANDDSEMDVVGGGAINEKKRTFGTTTRFPKLERNIKDASSSSSSNFRATSDRSHLMHAMEGLDRYPNYLSRWSIDDTEELERALEERLAQVRQQKQTNLQRRQGLQMVVEKVCQDNPEWQDFLQVPRTWDEIRTNILDPQATKAIFRSKSFRAGGPKEQVPSVQEVLSGKATVELDAGYLEVYMDEEIYDVYSFPLLAPSFCSKLQQFVRKIMEELETNPEFQHLNRGVRDLDNLGLGWINDLLLHLVVRPIARHIYQETDILGDLDWRQGYVAAYAASPSPSKPRQRLVPHTDDSEVTLNICIGDVFDGGLLNFWGIRGTDQGGTLLGEYHPEVGRALLHSGRHLHEVTEVTSGNRFAFILWARSWSGTRAQTCPCCWLNNRGHQDKNCVCGPRWN